MDNVTIELVGIPFLGKVEVLDDNYKECGSNLGYTLVITIPFSSYPDYTLDKLCPNYVMEMEND